MTTESAEQNKMQREANERANARRARTPARDRHAVRFTQRGTRQDVCTVNGKPPTHRRQTTAHHCAPLPCAAAEVARALTEKYTGTDGGETTLPRSRIPLPATQARGREMALLRMGYHCFPFGGGGQQRRETEELQRRRCSSNSTRERRPFEPVTRGDPLIQGESDADTGSSLRVKPKSGKEQKQKRGDAWRMLNKGGRERSKDPRAGRSDKEGRRKAG